MPILVNESGTVKTIGESTIFDQMYINTIDELGYDHYKNANRISHVRISSSNIQSTVLKCFHCFHANLKDYSASYGMYFDTSSKANSSRLSNGPLCRKYYDYILVLIGYNPNCFHAAENVIAKGITNSSPAAVEPNNTITLYQGQSAFLIPVSTLTNTYSINTNHSDGKYETQRYYYERYPFTIANVFKQVSNSELKYLGPVDAYLELNSSYTTYNGSTSSSLSGYHWDESITIYFGASAYLKNQMGSTDWVKYIFIDGGPIRDAKTYGIKLRSI